MTDKDAAEKAKELFVYGPIGLALYVRDTAPSFLKLFVQRGRSEFEQRRRDVGDHLDQARVAGESATSAGGPQVLRVVADGLSAMRERAEEALGALGVRPGNGDEPAEDAPASTSTYDWSPSEPVRDDSADTEVRPLRPVLPIPDYDDLSASQVVDRLEGLGMADLEQIRDYEAANRARNTILGKIEQLTREF
jgi:hypothetical protein